MSNKDNKENGLVVKWGYDLFDDGITNLPQCVARYGRRFVTPGEFSFIVNVFSYQYGSDLPYPSQDLIAYNMGITVRQIGKWIASLEQKELIEIYYRYDEKGNRTSNEYSFKPLLDKCLAESKKEKAEKEKRVTKKKAKKKTNCTRGTDSEKITTCTSSTTSTCTTGTDSSGPEVQVVPRPQVQTNKEFEERNKNKEVLKESVCSEEQQIIALLESRSDVDSHTHKQLTLLLNAVKKKDNFQYFIFRDTLEKVDFDIQNIGYFKRALTNNLKEGSVWPSPKKRTGTIIRKERVPKWLDEKENEEATVSKQSQPIQYTEEKIRELKARLAKYRA